MTCRRRYLDKISEVRNYNKKKIEEAPAFDMKRTQKKISEMKRPLEKWKKRKENKKSRPLIGICSFSPNISKCDVFKCEAYSDRQPKRTNDRPKREWGRERVTDSTGIV